MVTFKQLDIWKDAFLNEDNAKDKERISAALDAVRKKGEILGRKISADFPNLTVHDITHMDALWKVADQLVGREHKLNPLEIFILGSTFYLHDAALCFDAYHGGKDAVQLTSIWQDARWRHKQSGQDDTTADANADFDAVRALHAQQAEQLAHCNWQQDKEKPQFYAIEDTEIRAQHGPLIGKIAASHHWDIHQVQSDLVDFMPPMPSLPNEWTIRPILLATILRCSDAAQIDGTRAPDHLLQLLNASGVSLDHWKAQKRIGAITLLKNSAKLLIATTTPFKTQDASAWWVAYDAVQMIEGELTSSNSLLEMTYDDIPVLLANGVSNNTSPKDLSYRLQTDGWEPIDATVKVGDVEKVVGTLGGQQLYGSDDILAVVMRELIQNALDAVTARRAIDSGFDVKVEMSIQLQKHPLTGNWVLRVADKGVGMSPNVLLNALLDFGNSFWSSSNASQEFPGLQSKNPQIIGRFGIGFFSVFSVAKSVNVFSRRFDASYDDFRCLKFPKGLSLRPLHSATKPEEALTGFSTIIEVEISPDHCSDGTAFEVKANMQGQKNFHVRFAEFISSMICDVRADIEIIDSENTTSLKVGGQYDLAHAKILLNRLSFNSPSDEANKLIDLHAHRMRKIQDNNKVYGFAALTGVETNGYHFVSSRTIDGLSTPHNRGTDSFVGWLECECLSAKRDAGNPNVPPQALKAWLDDQIELFETDKPSLLSRFTTAGFIEGFGGDPRTVLSHLPILKPDGSVIGIELSEISTFITQNKLMIPVAEYGHIDSYYRHSAKEGIFVLYPYVRAGITYRSLKIENSRPTEPNSLIAIITESAEASGIGITLETIPSFFKSILGPADALLIKPIIP